MRTATAYLKNLINSSFQEFVKADLYEFFDYAGSSLGRFTNVDIDLQVNDDGTAGGPIFLGNPNQNKPIFTRSQVNFKIGVEVDSMDIEVNATASMTLAGVAWFQALRNGALDGGRCVLKRFLSDGWTNTQAGTVYLFGGRIGPLSKVGRSSATITVLSDLNLLNIQMPRELYASTCSNTLYDGKCTLNRATYKVSNAVAAGSSISQINSTLAQATGYFDLGYMVFTSGVNNGVTRGIKSFASGGAIQLFTPLFAACSNGDTFDIYPGCDKTQATCTSKFSNVVNFRGFPYIPIPETAV